MAQRRFLLPRILHWTCSLLLIGCSVYLIVLALSDGVNLFDLHPICMGIAVSGGSSHESYPINALYFFQFLVLFPLAIALFEPDYYKSINHKQRVQYHLYCQLVGISLTVIGFFAIYVNKNLTHKSPVHHFKSYHGICGLIVTIFICVVGLGGSLAYYSFSLRAYIRPVLLKIYHGFGGILALIIANITVVLGFYSNWYRKNGNPHLIWAVIVVIVLNTLLVLRKSMLTLKDRVMSVFVRNSL